ncbi:MAG: hypothetical protein HY315_05950 [Acidobacteria bacterium]|nr:hypothetical protein [Acidobacteriota bacterium]
MRTLGSSLIIILTASLLAGQNAPPAGGRAVHNPLKFQCDARPASTGRISLTCAFELNPKYDINLVPKPKVDVVSGEASLLPAQLVPVNVRKARDPRYYGEMGPVSATVDRRPGLQARFTYFFCSKKDGFCAQKIEKVNIQLP